MMRLVYTSIHAPLTYSRQPLLGKLERMVILNKHHDATGDDLDFRWVTMIRIVHTRMTLASDVNIQPSDYYIESRLILPQVQGISFLVFDYVVGVYYILRPPPLSGTSQGMRPSFTFHHIYISFATKSVLSLPWDRPCPTLISRYYSNVTAIV